MKALLNFHLARDVELPVPWEVLETLRARFPDVEFVAADDAEALAREAPDSTSSSKEPLPTSSPLWTLPNVILTPHVAGARPHYLERALDLFTDNLGRHLAGQALLNQVDPIAGYPLRD